jgi:hypothetical protein
MMKRLLIPILILLACHASATVEDAGSAAGSTASRPAIGWSPGDTGAIIPGPGPSIPSMPSLDGFCPQARGCLRVTVGLTGPKGEEDRAYTTQGKAQDYIVTVKNDGPSDVEAELSVNPKDCSPEWFSWTSKTLDIPAGASRSEALSVRPDLNALAGTYGFAVEASARCCRSGSGEAVFKVQDYDYASETAVSGTGQFQIDKNVRSMDSGIHSDKNILFSGSVDALVKNEYLVDQAKGRNPNFQEQDAVDNYNARMPGDALLGTESFKSSAIFGGVGAKLLESYDVQQMEFKNQEFNLHQTGSQKKMAELRTADNFTGFYLIDAKQTKPGQKSLKERDEYLGSFEINRRILFRDRDTAFKGACFDGSCTGKNASLFVSPCASGSCADFATRLNAFAKS